MKSKGLKADTVKYTNIDPAARIGMLVAKKIPAIETFAMSMPGVVKAAGGAEAQIFLLANAGLSLYSNGILVREDYLKAEPAKVKAFVKASLQGWKDAIANPKEAADIVGKHIKGLDADVVLQEIIIVNALVATPEARAKGLGTIDAKVMAESVDLIANNTGAGRQGRGKGRVRHQRAAAAADQAVTDGAAFGVLDRVDKSFAGPGRGAPDIVALQDVSYSFKQGELVALLGPSGCGKTTLLRIVAGMTRASHGRVEIRGSRGARAPGRFRLRLPGAEPAAVADRAGRCVLFPMEIAGRNDDSAKKRALELLDLVGLSAFAKSRPHQLSGGMKQRVALCRALVPGPSLLLMDEPFGALDELTRMEMQDLLLDIRRVSGTTVVFVTHSISEAIYLADEVLVFSRRPGRVVDRIRTELAYPRSAALRYTPEFTALEHRAGAGLGVIRERNAS